MKNMSKVFEAHVKVS